MMKKMLGDTNIAIRLLVGDKDIELSEGKEQVKVMVEETRKIAEKVTHGQLVLEIPDTVVAEMVYVLHSYYKVERAEISRLILGLLEVDGVESSTIMKTAVREYATNNLDIVDIQLAVLSRQYELPVLTWDSGFERLDCDYKTPSDFNNSDHT
ncbi:MULTISPECIES: PIN domain-containing protein [Paenibacillus]|uniref:PIN domain-containing protein n=1 Tax=Paenibacillus borealis TaxID=160799 RepID=A0ABX3GV63_PAEBO|nr:PIN domain-containing protein [Paenibacillus borealis]OMD38075.1 hypothetical protein BSK56_30670 [Paenibacillus borealis]